MSKRTLSVFDPAKSYLYGDKNGVVKPKRWRRFWCFFGRHPVECVLGRFLPWDFLMMRPQQAYEVKSCPVCGTALYVDPYGLRYIPRTPDYGKLREMLTAELHPDWRNRPGYEYKGEA